MAYTFHSGKMASDQLDSALTNVVCPAAIKDGSLVVLGDLASDTTYDLNGKEYDVYQGAAPLAVTDEVVIVDYAGISEGEIAGNEYKMGIKLYDLEVPANVPARVRRLHLHDKFWLGASNFATAPTVGQFAAATAGAMTHTPAAALVPGQYNIKILLAKDLTAGMSTHGKIYLCEVVEL